MFDLIFSNSLDRGSYRIIA